MLEIDTGIKTNDFYECLIRLMDRFSTSVRNKGNDFKIIKLGACAGRTRFKVVDNNEEFLAFVLVNGDGREVSPYDLSTLRVELTETDYQTRDILIASIKSSMYLNTMEEYKIKCVSDYVKQAEAQTKRIFGWQNLVSPKLFMTVFRVTEHNGWVLSAGRNNDEDYYE